MQYWAGCYPPVSLSGIGKDTRICVGYSQIQQVSPSGADSLPFLPEHHADTSAHPFIDALEVHPHFCQLVVVHPADYIPFQVYLPLFVVVYRSSAGKLPDPCFHLRLGFGVNPQCKPFLSFEEAISQELYLSGICHHRFLPVHFQKQLFFNEWDDVFQGLFRTGLASAENYHIIFVSDKAVPSAFQLMVKLVQHNVCAQGQ